MDWKKLEFEKFFSSSVNNRSMYDFINPYIDLIKPNSLLHPNLILVLL